MEKRELGKSGVFVTPLGFGMLRLPLKAGAGASGHSTSVEDVDTELGIALLRHCIDSGINYLDTAYNYIGGASEGLVGQALQGGYRERVNIATKSPAWLYKEPGDFDRFLETQLERLQTDHVDCYLLHSLNGGSWKRVQRNDALASIQRVKEEGLTRAIGFSFHDDLDLFKEIIDAAPWDFVQIQLNYYDRNFQAGLEGMRMAAERGMGVVVMEPLRGGVLVNVPKKVQEIFDNSGFARTNAAWSLDWLWNLPEVTCVLSGMSSFAQIDENVALATASHPCHMSPEELAVLDAAKEAFDSVAAIPCTGCNYCVEMCPQRIAIPYNFLAYNMRFLFDDEELAKSYYRDKVPGFGRQGDVCTSCASCEEICPQHIEISSWMPKVCEYLAS